MSETQSTEPTQEEVELRMSQTPAEWKASLDVFAARRTTCDACDQKKGGAVVDRCMECGCIIVFKAALKTTTCPLGKWEV